MLQLTFNPGLTLTAFEQPGPAETQHHLLTNSEVHAYGLLTYCEVKRAKYWLSSFLPVKHGQKQRGQYLTLLYRSFSLYSAPTHWLVHGHMTSSNETVSHQMP